MNTDHKILTYDDVVPFPAGSSTEPLVDVRTYDERIESIYLKEDMLEITGDTILVRDGVARRLASANDELAPLGVSLRIVYGYRHPDVQKLYFDRRRAALAKEYPELGDTELDRLTHNFVAVPDVAGHPTGGAVDLTIVDSRGQALAMGTEIADYTDDKLIQTFDNRVESEAAQNRLLLHDAMIRAGFAPFYGEWWHFSYGDREWAAFYEQKSALYGPLEIDY